ncbi:unnamed protein product [Euphydryas editha]|uniref:Uncharacterized protein n=1 Tax=Euphydryas editha TaxID=104508 RepID=A0AAU9UK06_EUPED|nr:unnamed protein product [Euphydryas editha]
MSVCISPQDSGFNDADGLCLNNGCCGKGARTKLMEQARTQLEGALRSELTKLADVLANRAKRFDGKFKILNLIFSIFNLIVNPYVDLKRNSVVAFRTQLLYWREEFSSTVG